MEGVPGTQGDFGSTGPFLERTLRFERDPERPRVNGLRLRIHRMSPCVCPACHTRSTGTGASGLTPPGSGLL